MTVPYRTMMVNRLMIPSAYTKKANRNLNISLKLRHFLTNVDTRLDLHIYLMENKAMLSLEV
jgi:hypothetical protein